VHPEFAEWYRLVNPAPTAEVLQSRWTAIETLSKAPKSALGAIRVALGLPPGQNDYLKNFLDTFQKGDKTFRIRDNNLEHELLAAATVVNLMETADPQSSVLAAVGVICAACQGHRQNTAAETVGLGDRASNHIARQSSAIRHDLWSRALMKTPLDADAFKKIDEQVGQNPPTAALKELLGVVQDTVKTINEILEASKQSDQRQKLYEEELDIMWWLVGGRSRDLLRRFAAVPPEALAVVAGAELADLTRVEPGPMAIRAFVEQALHFGKAKPGAKAKIEVVVNAIDSSWRDRYTQRTQTDGLSAFCPLHTGLAEAVKSPQWQGAFFHLTGLDANLEMTLEEIGLQTYYERLFLRMASAQKEDA